MVKELAEGEGTESLVNAITWIVPPAFVGDIFVAEETAVLHNAKEGVVMVLYRSGDLAQGIAMSSVDALNLAAALTKNANEINLKAN